MLSIRIFILSITIFISGAVAQGINDPAPDFTLQSLDHGEVSLSDYSGKVVVLFFLGNTCPPCIGHAPIIQTNVTNYYNSEHVQVLGLDVWSNSANLLPGFKAGTGVTFPLLTNAQTVGYSVYGIPNQDYTIIVDQQGLIAALYNTYGGLDINAITEKIDQLLVTTAIGDNNLSKSTFELKPNYPNPFNPSTTIPFSIDRPQNIKLHIYDITGKLVRTLIDASLSQGKYALTWDGKDNANNPLSSGLYFSRLIGNSQSQVRQLILVK